MGNRAVITLDKNPNGNSPGIYLHWNGGAESVLAFCEAARELNCYGDSSYTLARLVQIIANYFGGVNSIGVGILSRLDCNNHDNGFFKVEISNAGVKLWQTKESYVEECIYLHSSKLVELDTLAIKATHPYWNPKDGDTSILQDILVKNREHFAPEKPQPITA